MICCLTDFVRRSTSCRVLDVRQVREAQHSRRLHEFLEEQADARPPLDADLRAARLEYGVRELEADDPVDRGTEVEPQRFAARGALDLHLVARQAEAARQRAIVELDDEVAAAPLVRGDRAGDVVAPVLVGRRREAPRGQDAHARQAGLAVLLQAVAVRVVENLARDVRAVEGRVGRDAHGGGRLARHRVAGDAVHDLRAVDELALADARAYRKQEFSVCWPVLAIVRPPQVSSRPATRRLDGTPSMRAEPST